VPARLPAPEQQTELNGLKQQIAALRVKFSSDAAMELMELVDGMMRWFVDLDDEINELSSRVHYLEREDDE
jgi:hypothetical protein